MKENGKKEKKIILNFAVSSIKIIVVIKFKL